jgi:magnesium chelatase family protein
MALGRAHSVAVTGVDGQLVEIEADIGRGLPAVHLVGLPDTALQEARDRIRAAVANSGEEWPDSKVILALSPATLPKVGSVYDLALVAAVLDAAKQVKRQRLRETVLLGELALDGRLRSVRGILPAVLAAKNAGWATVVMRGGQRWWFRCSRCQRQGWSVVSRCSARTTCGRRSRGCGRSGISSIRSRRSGSRNRCAPI